LKIYGWPPQSYYLLHSASGPSLGKKRRSDVISLESIADVAMIYAAGAVVGIVIYLVFEWANKQ